MVVFQQGRPALTSEWNLINQIGDFKTQQGIQTNLPSGWLKVGTIEDTGATTTVSVVSAAEAAARSGQALTSLTYGSGAFKYVCRDQTNIAVVNGWPIIIQDSSTNLLDILITLPAITGTYRYDVVFLEVWKQLVSYGDPIYNYGNVQSGFVPDNEIYWNVLGAESTKRVQIQYRVSTASNVSPSQYSDGLGQGSGITSFIGNEEFWSVGPKDIGLYRTHTGTLNTVDGYVYAIPMFLVYRRAQLGSNIYFSQSSISSGNSSWTSAVSGVGFDRPDSKYSDVIYPEDIIDTRHQIITSGRELDSALQESFRKLVSGELSTKVADPSSVSYSGGATVLTVGQLNGTGPLPVIATAASAGTFDFKRRAYSNAEIVCDHNIIEIPINNVTSWNYGDIFLSSFITPEITGIGEIVSIDGLYYVDTVIHLDPTGRLAGSVNNWSTDGTPTNLPTKITLSAQTFSSINPSIGSSCHVYMEFTFKYYASSVGFSDVPKKFYEVGITPYQSIATRDQTVPVRFNNTTFIYDQSHYPNQFRDSLHYDFLNYCGGNYTENYEFGHEYVYYVIKSSNSFSITCPSGLLNNYPILGVKTVQLSSDSGISYGNPEIISHADRTISGLDVIFNITLSTPISAPTHLLVKLYTGYDLISAGISGYDPTDPKSFKFFELSKQGKGIIDTYEMILVESSVKDINNNYVIDISTLGMPIVAVATYTSYDNVNSAITGQAYAYEDSGNRVDVSIVPSIGSPSSAVNSFLPVLSMSPGYSNSGLLPTRIWLTYNSPTSSTLYVPLLVHSYVMSPHEGPYTFYYKTTPYQGLLSSDIEKGKIEKEGSAVITSEGSGAIGNLTTNVGGTASITQGQRNVIVDNLGATSLLNYIDVGDYFNVTGSPYYYRISNVASNSITLAELFVEGTVISQSYSCVRLDVSNSNISNVINRMPTYNNQDDYQGIGTPIALGAVTASIINTETKNSMQDPLDTIINDFQLGMNDYSARGRADFVLTDGRNSFIKLGKLTPSIVYGADQGWLPANGYKKVYQAYLYNKAYYDGTYYRDLTGRVYLLVVSSETNQDQPGILLNAFSTNDAVDIFELVGRPIIKTL
jgi:hypothetical protein